MSGPNDGTVFSGPGEVGAAPITRTGMGGHQAAPNRFTAWDDGSGPRSGKRPMDAMLESSPVQGCPKCSFKTRIEPDFAYHTKKVGGLMKCERQRQAFGNVQSCSACQGSGETATGTCRTCNGMGKTLSRNPDAPAVDVNAAEIASKVAEAMNPAFNAIADALKQLAAAVTTPKQVKAKKPQRKGKARGSARMDRRGDQAAGSKPLPALESTAEPMGDPAAGPEAAK